MSKVLIGIGTFDKFSYIENKCFESIRKQTNKDFDVLIVDNSETKGHYFDLLTKNPDFKIKHIKRARFFRDALALTRKEIVNYAATSDYEYLLFIDVDHILQPNTLEKLIAHKKDFTTALIGYFSRDVSTIYKKGNNKQLEAYKWSELENKKLLEIKSSGLACALIKTKFLLGIEFFVTHKKMAFCEDTTFCADLIEKGAKLFCDPSVKPIHVHISFNERIERRNCSFKSLKVPNQAQF